MPPGAVAAREQQHVADEALEVAQAFERAVGHHGALRQVELRLAQVAGIQQRGGERRAQLVGEPGDHLAHGREALVALGGQAHAVGVGDVRTAGCARRRSRAPDSDRAKRRGSPSTAAGSRRSTNSPGVPLSSRRAASSAHAPGKPAAEQALGGAVGLHHGAGTIDHQHPGGQRPISTDRRSLSWPTWACSAA